MLWYKGWLETRFRVLFILGFFVLMMGLVARTTNSRPSSPRPAESLPASLPFYLSMIPVMLAGAGIKTQTILRTTRGLHESMYFTLSLPVSRVRLLAIRAGIGMLETLAVLAALPWAAWIIFPALRAHLTGSDLFAYWVALSACVTVFYCLSVLLATFLDDLWQIWGSAIVILVLRWISTEIQVPSSLNIFQAIGQSSPLFTHTLPWASMGVSLGGAAILFCAAIWVVQTREY